MDELGINEIKKKPNKWLIASLIILIIIGIGVIIFILQDTKKEDKKTEEVITDVNKMSDEEIINALKEEDLNIEEAQDESLENLDLEIESIDESYDINLD